ASKLYRKCNGRPADNQPGAVGASVYTKPRAVPSARFCDFSERETRARADTQPGAARRTGSNSE
ncbi:MAG: hypothetical protein N2A42_08290, partial [Luteolibacter sp.]